MVAATMMRGFKGMNTKELFYDLLTFILIAFVCGAFGEFR